MNLLRPHASLARLFPAKSKHVNYLINWASDLQIIYVETPKVGCTTIKQILQYSELRGDDSRMPDDVHDRTQSPLRSPAADEECFLRCLESEEYFRFSFVRNPYTRILSAYLDKIVGKPGEITPIQEKMGIDPAKGIPSFEEFVDLVYDHNLVDINPHWSPQTFLLGFRNVRYDYLGRFEYFDESIKQLVSRQGLLVPEGALHKGRDHATNAGRRVQDHYTPRAIERVRSIYYDDFRYLGYGWSL